MLVEQEATDGALVEAVRAGDDTAFEELYRRYQRRIGAFVYGYVRDEGRAEDVTQEAFMSALRRMRETDSEIAFRPWIYEIARNAAIDLHRRNSRAQEVSISSEDELPSGDELRLVGRGAPESALVDKERIENLRGAFDELSESHHRILVLRELEGLSYREIASRMDLTAPAVESTLFRARRRLEHEYSELDTGRRCRSMRSVIAQLAEGVDLPRERSKLERHATRCSRCRRRARELGIEPMQRERVGIVSRAAAFLPLPALIRRHVDNGSLASTSGPAAEGTAGLLGKAGALLAAAVLAGGGGATLGGYGPLAPPSIEERDAAPAQPTRAKRPPGKESHQGERRAPARSDAQSGAAKRTPRPGMGSAIIKRKPAAASVRRPAPPVIPPDIPKETVPRVLDLKESQSTSGFELSEVVVPEAPKAPEPAAAASRPVATLADAASSTPPPPHLPSGP